MKNLIEKIQQYKNNSNEDGSTLSVWYVVEYKCGRCREFKKLSRSGDKFMKSAKVEFSSALSPKGYRDSDGVERGNPDAVCTYGHTQHHTVYAV